VGFCFLLFRTIAEFRLKWAPNGSRRKLNAQVVFVPAAAMVAPDENAGCQNGGCPATCRFDEPGTLVGRGALGQSGRLSHHATAFAVEAGQNLKAWRGFRVSEATPRPHPPGWWMGFPLQAVPEGLRD
jgi:hypothetical protein